MDQPLGSRYLLHDLLGRGAMGQVYRASVRDTGAPVAVKILKPELVSDPGVVARFFQERSMLTSISDPHVVRVIDLVVEGETIGIVMELVEGQDLRGVLWGRTLPPAEAVGLTRQLLDGLTAVHAAGIIHRDIKPENVLADASGERMCLKVTDFGVARLSYGASLTKLSSLIGTPEYMAPEVADHDTAAPATDLYSAGIVLYEMLCGRTPFAGGHPLAVLRRHVEHAPPPIPGVPPQLWAQIESLLAKDPQARPESAAASAAALGSLESSLAGLPALPPMEAPAHVSVTPSRTVTNLGRPARPAVPVTLPPGLEQYETISRPRDSGGSPAPSPAGGPPPQSRPKRSGLRSRPAVLALPAALVVVAAAVGGVLLTRSGHAATGTTVPSRAAAYAFAPQQYPDGLLIVRRWTLSGKDGSQLTETITASSATGKALRVPFRDAIPATIAATTQTVHFTPVPTKIVQADPVVQWRLRLPAQGTITIGYRAVVSPAGATMTRLARWAKAFTSLQASLHTPKGVTIQLHSLAINPRTLRIGTAASTQPPLTGQLSSGKSAPQQILSGAAWTTGNPAVATVDSSGRVTGIGPGTTHVTAQIGTAHASATVVVTRSSDLTPGSSPATTGGSSPGSGQPSPIVTRSTSGPGSSTPTPSTGSPTPSPGTPTTGPGTPTPSTGTPTPSPGTPPPSPGAPNHSSSAPTPSQTTPSSSAPAPSQTTATPPQAAAATSGTTLPAPPATPAMPATTPKPRA
jgi:serine/threonine protein kinase